MNDYLVSLILGIVEGLTEFIPVSSTAHLRISEALLKVDLSSGFWKMYTVVIQLGAILCLPIYFRKKLGQLFRTFPRGEDRDRTALTHPISLTLIACAVTVLPAYLLHKQIGQNLESLFIIGASLLIGGVIMWIVDAWSARSGIQEVKPMSLPQAIWIGAAQVLSTVFPGTSRSMSTITAGQIAGLTRLSAIEFSFLLSIPTMVAATGYEFLKSVVFRRSGSGETLPPVEMDAHRWAILAIGFLVSFAVSWAVVAWFMSRIRRRGLAPFATYRIVLGLLVLTWAFYPAGTTRNNPAQATSGTPPSADSQPYDVLRSAYAQYMDLKDPLTFPMKVRAVATNPYKFWRGTKDMFAIWCKTNAGDWLKDRQAYMPIHGDLHLGNIGAYPTGPEPDRMAFGLIDFDDSVRLPFQFELLQGLITLQLAARQNNVELTNAQKVEFSEMLFDWYRRAVQSHRQASDLLANDKEVMRLLSRNKSYEHELLKYTESNGKFRPAVINGERVTNVLRPTAIPVQVFADAVSQAIGNAPRMKAAFRFSDPISVRRAIKDVALRTRTGSCGSQGLKKYLILLDRPLIGADHDLILYIKLEIPTAAERTGLIATDPRPQGQRTVEDTEALTDPQPGFVSWCEIANESYWVTSRDARTDELDPEAIKDYKSLLKAAHIWATVAGAAHGREGRDRVILPRLATELRTSIRRRADTYVTKVLSDFAAFKHDPRVAGDIAAAEEAITASMKPRP